MVDVIRLVPSQKSLAVRTFARSFFNYPMMVEYWPDIGRRERYLEWYLGCAIEYGLRYGQVYTTPDVAGVAIWLPPGQTRITNMRSIRAGFLPAPFLMGFRHFLNRANPSEELISKMHRENVQVVHWYLWSLAVDPDRQGKGVGTNLLQSGLEKADAENLPCYLETHDEKNIPFYTNRGFSLIRTVKVPGSGMPFWCFLRKPGPGG